MNPDQLERYSRQILFQGIGESGQINLLASSVLLVGCGALGTAAANLLVRAGVGRLRIIDRDFVAIRSPKPSQPNAVCAPSIPASASKVSSPTSHPPTSANGWMVFLCCSTERTILRRACS